MFLVLSPGNGFAFPMPLLCVVCVVCVCVHNASYALYIFLGFFLLLFSDFRFILLKPQSLRALSLSFLLFPRASLVMQSFWMRQVSLRLSAPKLPSPKFLYIFSACLHVILPCTLLGHSGLTQALVILRATSIVADHQDFCNGKVA